MTSGQAIRGRFFSNTKLIAELTGIPSKTWELWRRTGYGPEYIRIGKRVLYDENEVIAWLDNHRMRSTSQKSGVEK